MHELIKIQRSLLIKQVKAESGKHVSRDDPRKTRMQNAVTYTQNTSIELTKQAGWKCYRECVREREREREREWWIEQQTELCVYSL